MKINQVIEQIILTKMALILTKSSQQFQRYKSLKIGYFVFSHA